jgi:ribonucleoside-diphosphate reductase alpha chain
MTDNKHNEMKKDLNLPFPYELVSSYNLDPKVFEVLQGMKYDSNFIRSFALRLGRNFSNPDNGKCAGKLVLYDITRSCGNILEYVDAMNHLLSDKVIDFMTKYHVEIDADIEQSVSLEYNLFSASVLVKSYLMKPTVGMDAWESIQQMYYRIAAHTHSDEGFERVRQCKDEMAKGWYTCASPTLFNSGTKRAQTSSCFLLNIGDNLPSIFERGVSNAAMISATNGGLGIVLSAIRHSQIGDVGVSSGVVPAARVIDRTVKYVDQGGKRDGACTVFLDVHHIDVMSFINATDNFTDQTQRFQTLNTCIWTNGVFYDKLKKNEPYYLFCPAKSKELQELSGYELKDAYETMVIKAEESKITLSNMDKTLKTMKNDLISNATPEKRSAYVKYINMFREFRKHHIEYVRLDSASELMDQIVKVQMSSSMPYIMHGDAVNWKNNHRHLGAIRGANLCVSGETTILTREGHIPIIDLVGKEVDIWNGDAWSTVKPKQTSESAHLLYVELDNGLHVTCTYEHKFLISHGGEETYKTVERVPAINLKAGMELFRHGFPLINGDEKKDFTHPYTHGFWCGDGISHDRDTLSKSCILYGNKKELLPFLSMKSIIGKEDEKGPLNTVLTDEMTEDKFQVPTNSSVKCRLDWIAGLFDSDGIVAWNMKNANIQLCSFRENFLYNVQLMLQTLGVTSYVSVAQEGGKRTLPYSKELILQKQWRITIYTFDLMTLLSLGYTPHRLDLSKIVSPNSNENPFVRVKGVHCSGRTEPTYCFTEHINNAGVFGGVLTGQCLEIIQYTSPEKTASCNLASHDVSRFTTTTWDSSKPFIDQVVGIYDWDTFSTACKSVVEGLDNRIDNNWYPLDERDKDGNVTKQANISSNNMDMRPLGIGVSGLADAFLQMDIVYDSPQAELFNKIYFASLYFNSLCESVRIASVKGAYPASKHGSYKTFKSIDKETGSINYGEEKGSHFSNGVFQFNLWNEQAEMLSQKGDLYSGYDRKDDIAVEPSVWGQKPFTFKTGEELSYTIDPSWESLSEAMIKFGVRNSMLTAIMPTASTANIFCNAESTEPYQAVIFSRTVMTGTYLVANRHLLKDLISIGCWSETLLRFFMIDQGSIRYIMRYIDAHPNEFPEAFVDGKFIQGDRITYLIKKYKTTYEISQKHIIKMARQRGIYIDQSQSLNIHLKNPTKAQLKAIHSYTYMMGLKTGMYYLRQDAATFIGSFDIDVNLMEFYKSVTGEKISTKNIITMDDVTEDKDHTIPTVCRFVPGKEYDPGCISCQ